MITSSCTIIKITADQYLPTILADLCYPHSLLIAKKLAMSAYCTFQYNFIVPLASTTNTQEEFTACSCSFL